MSETLAAYEDWFAELSRIFSLLGYQQPPSDSEGWREYHDEGRTPAEAIAADMANAV